MTGKTAGNSRDYLISRLRAGGHGPIADLVQAGFMSAQQAKRLAECGKGAPALVVSASDVDAALATIAAHHGERADFLAYGPNLPAIFKSFDATLGGNRLDRQALTWLARGENGQPGGVAALVARLLATEKPDVLRELADALIKAADQAQAGAKGDVQ